MNYDSLIIHLEIKLKFKRAHILKLRGGRTTHLGTTHLGDDSSGDDSSGDDPSGDDLPGDDPSGDDSSGVCKGRPIRGRFIRGVRGKARLRLSLPLNMSFLCTSLSYLHCALICHLFPLQSKAGETKCIKKGFVPYPDLPRQSASPLFILPYPLSISFLCAFLSSLHCALIYHLFPLQSKAGETKCIKKEFVPYPDLPRQSASRLRNDSSGDDAPGGRPIWGRPFWGRLIRDCADPRMSRPQMSRPRIRPQMGRPS